MSRLADRPPEAKPQRDTQPDADRTRQRDVLNRRDPADQPEARDEDDDDGNPIPAVPELVPMNYNAETMLEFNVEDGKNNIADFALESE